MPTKTMPKNYERFKKLLPHDGFTTLKPDDFKEMMKIIHNEQDTNMKHTYFTYVLDKLFANGWGWYMRLGQSLSAMRRYAYAYQLPEKTQTDALKVLRMVKDMHIELNYRPSRVTLINSFIREFGGRTLTHAEKETQKNAKFARAKAALAAGEKLPRKLKKEVTKKMTQNSR